MREIKYRGFDPITKKFIYGNLLFTNETYYIIPFLTNGCMSQKEMMLRWVSPCYQVIPETIGQFTGLHDKNGVEIYEGDKILYTDNFKVNGTTSHTSIVEWVSEIGGFYIKVIGCGYYNLNKSQCEKYDYEVIGNIHERSKQDEEVK